TIKDSTGRKHTHITKVKSNQRFTVGEAESKEEAKVYINYIKDEVGLKQFVSDLKNTVQKLNKSKTSVASYIQTRSGQNILRLSKNGTRYIFFDNMSFTAPTKQPIVKPKEKTKYKFKSGGKKKMVIAEAN
ncbi:DUF1381 domain-containing protein, partial [Staphylococcus aureus]|uniref:DUF1381 domain-containing protein n=1 Tax=Staphylococcus aureus TaxID=1280 RepID=UPI00210C406B